MARRYDSYGQSSTQTPAEKKLWVYGIRGKVHSWIKEFLSERSQKEVINGKSYDSAKVTS